MGLMLLISQAGVCWGHEMSFSCQVFGYLIRKTCVKYPILLKRLSYLNSYHVRRYDVDAVTDHLQVYFCIRKKSKIQCVETPIDQ